MTVSVFDVANYMDPANPDNTAGLQALAAAVQANGGGQVDFPFGCDYHIFPSLTANWPSLFQWSNLKFVQVNFRGSRILVDAPNANAFRYNLFQFNNCNKITIRDADLEQIGAGAGVRSYTGGGCLAYIVDQCRDIEITNAYQKGGCLGVAAVASAPGLPRADGMEIRIRCDEVFYPLSFEGNGDNAYGAVESHHAGRTYFPWSVRNHEFLVKSDHADGFNDIAIAAAPGWGDLANVYVKYTHIADPNAALPGSNSKIAIYFESAPNPNQLVYLSNVTVDLDVTSNRAVDGAVCFIDENSGGAGHLMSNVKLSGRVLGWNGTPTTLFGFFTNHPPMGDWVFNIGMEDLDIESALAHSIAIDPRALFGAFFLRRVRGPAVNMTYPSGYTVPAAYQDYKQVQLANLSVS